MNRTKQKPEAKFSKTELRKGLLNRRPTTPASNLPTDDEAAGLDAILFDCDEKSDCGSESISGQSRRG